ncbi:hypothetical protein KY285_010613 [Solanum tuberosum]|nr:hypothetical protein KY289_011157 [Solanum tuberosum]KAH0734906.1 hypothetical protein KY285_010613 [Solanum tuberosum]
MDTTSGGQLLSEEFPPLLPNGIPNNPNPLTTGINYVNMLKPKIQNYTGSKIPPKLVTIVQGEPNVTWKSSEVRNLIIQENLQYAIIEKFSYEKPEIGELRKTLPKHCGIKGESTIGVLDSRHILIRLSLLEDYVLLLSTFAYYVKAKEKYWQMRTLKWDPWFEPDVETTIGVAWISMLDLPPNCFAKEAIFSIASAVGKPLTVDMATRNQTRPSCAKVKVEVDLVAKLPQRVKINEEDDIIGEIKSKWIKIQYDHMPMYCSECCLQGHDENNCWNIHPELHEGDKQEQRTESGEGANATQRKILASGKVEGISQNYQWLTRKRKFKKDRYGHVIGEINDKELDARKSNNSFEVLREVERENYKEAEQEENQAKEMNTKEWVQRAFSTTPAKVTQREEEKHEKTCMSTSSSNEVNQEKGNNEQQFIQQEEEAELKKREKSENIHEEYKGSLIVVEEANPLQVDNQKIVSNGEKDNMDTEDLKEIVNRMAIEGNLSLTQVETINEIHGKQKRKGTGERQFQTTTRQTRSTVSKSTKSQ